MSNQDAPCYIFDRFCLYPDEREFHKNKSPFVMGGRAFDVLSYLVKNQHRKVPMAELGERVWRTQSGELSDYVAVRVIARVRGALDDSAREPKLIVNFRGSAKDGIETSYQFVGKARSVTSCDCRKPPTSALAVLPFEVVGSDHVNEHRGGTITFMLTTQIADVVGNMIEVRSSNTVSWAEPGEETTASAESLNVNYVVKGKIDIDKKTDTFSLYAELIDVDRKAVLLGFVFRNAKASQLQDAVNDLTQRIVLALELKLSKKQEKQLVQHSNRKTEAIEAVARGYKEYMRGRRCWDRRTQEGLESAINHFEEAIRIDGNYALAYVGLANSYAMLSFSRVGARSPREAMPLTIQAAKQALELDPNLGEAHTVLAWVAFIYEWNWKKAEKLFRKAIRLDPNYSTAHHWYAILLAAMKRQDEAVNRIKRAEDLAPISSIIINNVGLVYFFGRDYAQAIEQYQQTLRLDPDFLRAHYELGRVFEQQGNYKRAISEFEEVLKRSSQSPRMLAALGHAYALSGKRSKATEMLTELTRLAESSHRYVSPYDFATVYIGLDEKVQALDWLDKAYHERSSWLVHLNVDPLLDSLREEPRFQKLVRQLRLP